MGRQARQKSGSGYYHVICRGIGRQLLFEEKEDYLHCLGTLERYAAGNGAVLIAYCLMSNHIHLIVHAQHDLDRYMKQVLVSYAQYYNLKYDRVGHLFQNRYQSMPIEEESYLLQAVRYVHNNPQRAGIGQRESYPWSSYGQYEGRAGICDTSLILGIIGGEEAFCAFSLQEEGEYRAPSGMQEKVSDEEARRILLEEMQLSSGTQLQQMDRESRDAALTRLRAFGLTVRQIERLTGINRGVIQRMKL